MGLDLGHVCELHVFRQGLHEFVGDDGIEGRKSRLIVVGRQVVSRQSTVWRRWPDPRLSALRDGAGYR